MREELRTTSKEDLVTTTGPEVVAVEKATADAREVATVNKHSSEIRSSDHASRNQALVSYWALPLIFLTVALLGGLRVSADDHAFIFFPPPLITLVLAVLLMLLFVRGGLIELRSWIAAHHPPLRNVSHIDRKST